MKKHIFDLAALAPAMNDIADIAQRAHQKLLDRDGIIHAGARRAPSEWYVIKAQGENRAEVLIFEQIGKNFFGEGVSAKEFVDELNAMGDVSEITLRINSPGGNVFEGMAIYNALLFHSARVVARVEGVAASAASVIAMAGDEVLMPETSTMMIHDASALTIGNQQDHERMAEALGKVDSSLVTAYTRHSGLAEDEIRTLMDAETTMTASEALEKGFATQLVETPVAAAAGIDWRNHVGIPETRDIVKPGDEGAQKMNLSELKQKHPELVAEIQAETTATGESAAKEAATAAAKAATEAERVRINGIRALYAPGCEALVEEMCADSTVSVEAAAIKLNGKMREMGAEALAKVTGSRPDPVKTSAPKDPAPKAASDSELRELDPSSDVFEAACKQRYDADRGLQDEYSAAGGFPVYHAYMKATISGSAKHLAPKLGSYDEVA